MAAGTYNELMTSIAQQHGIQPSQLSSIIGVENPNQQVDGIQSYTGVQGFAQITHATWTSVYGPNVPYSTNVSDQLNCAATLLARYDQDYLGNTNLAAAAYNAGPGVANLAKSYLLQDPTLSSADAISRAAANYNISPSAYSKMSAANQALFTQGPDGNYYLSSTKQNEVNNYIARVNGQANPSRSYGTQDTGGPDDTNPIAALPVQGSTISPSQLTNVLNTINPPVYDTSGLDQTPWYSDSALVKNTAPTKQFGSPVTFRMNFSRNGDASGLLSDSQGNPIVLKLKASIHDFEKTMKHAAHVSSTRTATLVNLWGMNADTIIGRGSTGLFQNSQGVTDYISGSALYKGQKLSADKYRVAAKDAFIEMLSGFKSNGVVWYKGDNGLNPSTNQVGADAWSSVTGATSYEINARNNDVWSRGAVEMIYRNSHYFGFFNSLTWALDASKPFVWNFSFVFQVERTITNLHIPRSTT